MGKVKGEQGGRDSRRGVCVGGGVVAPRAFCVHKVEKYIKTHGDVRKDSPKSWELKEVSCNW